MKARIIKAAALIMSLVLIISAQTISSAEPTEFTKSAADFVSGINCGWNLGNALDSTPAGNETAWGSPVITKELIDAIRLRGFNAIRIPITYNETIGAAPDYKIRATYLARIKEVVDYAVANDMYILINAHHESGWLSSVITDSSGNIKQTEYNAMLARFSSLWTQVATVFRDYGEKLMFAGFNEIGKGSYTATDEQMFKGIDKLNQTFFDAVRATGGNNAKRYLVMVGAGAAISGELTPPTDPANHIILEFHFYEPRKFCARQTTGNLTVFSSKQLNLMLGTALDNGVDKFLSRGIPIIAGEMGAVDKDNESERCKYVTSFVNICGEYGVKAFWWDNNAFGVSSEHSTYGLINRSTGEWIYGSIADAMITEANKYIGVTYPTTTTEPTTLSPATAEHTTLAPTTTKPSTTEPTTKAINYGDCNADKSVNAKDVLILKQYLADWVVTIDSAASDVNADNTVNAKDLLRLRQYLADWDVPLGK